MDRKGWIEREGTNAVAQKMKLLRSYAVAWATGREHALIVSGPAGIGKTSVVEAVCRRYGLATLNANPHSYIGLLKAFQKASDEGLILILDEADLTLTTHRNLQVAKKALDNPDRREYAGFDVGARWALTTNMPLDDLTFWPEKLRDHVKAVMTRCPPFVIPSDRHLLWEFTVIGALLHGCIDSVLVDDHAGTMAETTVAVRDAALDYFTVNTFRFADHFPPTVRVLRLIAAKMAAYGINKAIPYLDGTLLDPRKAAGKPPEPPKVFPPTGMRKKIVANIEAPKVVQLRPAGQMDAVT